MDASTNGGISNADTTGTSTSGVIAAAQQLQQAISQFAQEAGGNQERIIAQMKNGNGLPNGNGESNQEGQAGGDISSKASAMGQQLQMAASRLADDLGGHHDGVNSAVQGLGDQLREMGKSLRKTKEGLDLLASQLRNSRH